MADSNPIRRGLVIQGGGAKGAFALGCLKALREGGVKFSAVAGTSAGALCAIIWSTERIEEGIAAWKEIDQGGFFGRSPEGCFRRLLKMLCIAGKRFVAYLKNIELEGRPQLFSDVCFSLVVGIFAWLLLFNLLPFWGWLAAAIVIPVVALFAFGNELPFVGWDNRVRQTLVDAIMFVATTRFFVSTGWLLFKALGIVTIQTRITLSEAIGSGIILLMLRLPVRVETTLMEGRVLASQIGHFLKSALTIPTYVTVAQEVAPNSPHFMLPTPGVFKAKYAALHKAPANVRAQYAYASAALPFGIFAHAEIDGEIYVDGGVADNTPILPMAREEIDEVWIICLQPEAFDVPEHLRNVLIQTIFASGGSQMANKSAEALDNWMGRAKFVVLAPQTSLGGLFTGTLNFNRRRTESLLRHGYRVATRELGRDSHDSGEARRVYRPRFSLPTQCRLLHRALPPCSIWRLFGRSDVARENLPDFQVPPGARPRPGEENTTAWVCSIILLWLLFVTDALASEHPWKHVIVGTLVGYVMIGFPTWSARLLRNVGVRR